MKSASRDVSRRSAHVARRPVASRHVKPRASALVQGQAPMIRFAYFGWVLARQSRVEGLPAGAVWRACPPACPPCRRRGPSTRPSELSVVGGVERRVPLRHPARRRGASGPSAVRLSRPAESFRQGDSENSCACMKRCWWPARLRIVAACCPRASYGLCAGKTGGPGDVKIVTKYH